MCVSRYCLYESYKLRVYRATKSKLIKLEPKEIISKGEKFTQYNCDHVRMFGHNRGGGEADNELTTATVIGCGQLQLASNATLN